MLSSSQIIIIGSPRSGTTWVGKILDSHPGTTYFHEPDSPKNFHVPRIVTEAQIGECRDAVIEFSEHIRSLNDISIVGKLPVFPKENLSKIRNLVMWGYISCAKYISSIIKEPFSTIPSTILPPSRIDGQIIVWKSILSTCRLQVFPRFMPEVKTLLVIRHPCGQIASVMRGDAENAFEFSYPTSEAYGVFEGLLTTEYAKAKGLDMELIKNCNTVQRLAWRWVLQNEKALADAEKIQNCYILKYDDLAYCPMEKAKEILLWCGLSWNSQCQDFLLKSTSSHSSRYYSLTKDPKAAADRWKSDLTKEQIEQVFEITSDSIPGKLFE